MKIVEFKDVTKEFKVGETIIYASKGLNFSLDAGEFVVIIGPSGSGKTTLLNLLGGMDKVTSGTIKVGDMIISDYDDKQLTKFRRNYIGFVFQFYNLVPNLTAMDNVEISSELVKDSIPSEEILEQVGLKERVSNFPSQLSGGEQQRVAIARAVAKKPTLLLADEPTGALDYETGKKILRLLYDISKLGKSTVIMITHNTALTKMADHVIHIKNGVIIKEEYNANPQPIEEIEW